MKKKIILIFAMLAVMVCALALAVSAAECIDGIYYTFKNDEATVSAENRGCEMAVVVIPETVTAADGQVYKVTAIASSAFGAVSANEANQTVTSVTMPDTVTSIGEHSFRSCKNLTYVKLSPNVKKLINAVFMDSGIVTVDAKGSQLERIEGHSFRNCSSLESFALPDSVNFIGTYAFYGTSKLKDIKIPSQVTDIGESAFWGAGISGEVVLPSTLSSMSQHAFRECDNITGIVIKGTITSIYNASFYSCDRLEYVVLPATLQSLGQHVFNQCRELEYIVLGGSITSFSTDNLVSNCNSLKAVIYAGSEEKFKTLTGISAFGTVEYKDFSEYVHGTLPSARTVYCGAELCSSCNGILGEEGFIYTDLITEMKVGQECNHCDYENIKTTYASVFVDLGYSTIDINGSCSIVQGFKVDYNSMKVYNDKLENDISAFGVLAVAQSKVGTTAFDENGDALDGVIAVEIKSGHNYFDVKVANIPVSGTVDGETAYTDALLHLCAYVKAGDTVYYISENYVGTTLGEAASYNSVKK